MRLQAVTQTQVPSQVSRDVGVREIVWGKCRCAGGTVEVGETASRGGSSTCPLHGTQPPPQQQLSGAQGPLLAEPPSDAEQFWPPETQQCLCHRAWAWPEAVSLQAEPGCSWCHPGSWHCTQGPWSSWVGSRLQGASLARLPVGTWKQDLEARPSLAQHMDRSRSHSGSFQSWAGQAGLGQVGSDCHVQILGQAVLCHC